MKMLRVAVAEWKANVESEDFRKLIQHHVHILGLVKDISGNYSSILLGDFVLNALSVCFSLFCWTMDGLPPDMEHTTRYLNSVFNFGLSLFLICYAGDKLTDQCEGMTYVIFYKIMNDPLTKNSKFSSFMMMGRSQMRTAISIGGFWDLNMESYYMVMRKCMSFLTFMQALRDGGKKHNGDRSRTSLAF
ncbi:hypothetical protein WA026_001307 [Henosepilachna vigintioctopunctata]|uniref:Odorant receptor n=1 Tax=Henosepilachna vigintioctopunctata TaxID=420089 RepID=A0AAW1UPJ2_9CUCU